MKAGTWVVAGLLVIAAGGYLWMREQPYAQPAPGFPGGVVCTMEAKLCPDGSYVGRGGPKCEFAPCPTATATPASPAQVRAGIGQSAQALGVVITPILVLEDSRCPVDVQCIQAGTVRLRAQLQSGLGSAEQVFTLGQPITTEAETVTLILVSPAKNSTITIGPSEYVFEFEIRKR